MDYQKQANDFLKDTHTSLNVVYVKTDLYFPDDKDKRDIYRITLQNKRHKYVFNFGQSIRDSNKNTPPTAYDVLASIQKYPVGSFEDFCHEFGYDKYPSNSSFGYNKKSKKIYEAVVKEVDNINKLFTEEELIRLQDIN